jgi:hypothetical protein
VSIVAVATQGTELQHSSLSTARTSETISDAFPGIGDDIKQAGYAFAPGARMADAIRGLGLMAEWERFAASWDDLGLDRFMADGGRYRRRRFAAFEMSAVAVARKPHQPHYQSRDYNPLNGDIERWFEPVLDENADHPFLRTVFDVCRWAFASAAPAADAGWPWHAEMHQFRIEAMTEGVGRPTPEGMHRDGVDWVCVMLIKRENVQSGTTEIFDNASESVNRFTLTEPLDTVFLNDTRVRHGVTPISRLAPEREGYRDVLVLTFRRDGE